MRRAFSVAVVSVFAVSTLAACSSSSESAETQVGGLTECSESIINAEAEKVALEMGSDNQWYPDSVTCSNGWAVAAGTLGPKDAPDDGPLGAPTSFIFQQEGQFWVPKNGADVCGTPPADGGYPADATIPWPLYQTCLVI